MHFRNFTRESSRVSTKLPTITTADLCRAMQCDLRRIRQQREGCLPELSAYASISDAGAESPCFGVGEAERKYQFFDDSTLALHWPSLFRNLRTTMFLNPFVIPLVWAVKDVLGRRYPILNRLLYRLVMGFVGAHTFDLSADIASLQVRSDAFPVSNYEDALLRYYLAKAANDTVVLKTCDRVLRTAFGGFVITYKRRHISRYAGVRRKFTDAELDDTTFFDMRAFERFAREKPPLPAELDLPVESFKFPVLSSNWLMELLELSQYDPSAELDWCQIHAPITVQPGDHPADLCRLLAARKGFITSGRHKLVMINFARLEVSRVFGLFSPYGQVSAKYALNSEAHIAAQPGDIMGIDFGSEVAAYLNGKYSYLQGDTLDTNLLWRTVEAREVWPTSEFDSVFVCSLPALSNACCGEAKRQDTLSKKPVGTIGRRKGSKITPKKFVSETYGNVLEGVSVPIDLRITLFRRHLYVQFVNCTINPVWYSKIGADGRVIYFDGVYHDETLTSPIFSREFVSELFSRPTFLDVKLDSVSNFIQWLSSFPATALLFNAYYKRRKAMLKASANWNEVEDNCIIALLRPDMSEESKETLYNTCKTRTRREIVLRAGVLRRTLLQRGVLDVTRYPRTRAIPALNAAIEARRKELLRNAKKEK